MEATFKSGDYFIEHYVNKKGIVRYLRDDAYEKEHSWPNGDFHYFVDFKDGNFITYFNQYTMIKISKEEYDN
jgi:hypothetical protein